jgi:hypothetical protein
MRDVNPIFLDFRLRGSDGKTELIDRLPLRRNDGKETSNLSPFAV